MDSEFSEDEDIEEAKLRNLRLKRLGSFKAPNRNSLSRVKRLSQSNYELNAITPFKSKFTLFWKNMSKIFFISTNWNS